MSKKKKDISEAVTLESMDENIVVADTEAEGEPSVSEEKEEWDRRKLLSIELSLQIPDLQEMENVSRRLELMIRPEIQASTMLMQS